VKQSGCNGFTDDEVFSMAVHYYDEDTIESGKAIDYRVIVNHTVVLTEEEKQEARQEAILKVQNEAYARMKQPQKKISATPTAGNNQPSLF
jgi:hypothetical protein